MKCGSTLQAYLQHLSYRKSIAAVECYAGSPLRTDDEQTVSALSFSHAAAKSEQNADVRVVVSFTSYKLV